MRIYLMTDIEGVAGVISYQGWAFFDGRYFRESRRLLSMEVNAAVEGFYGAGAKEIVVVDGHGGGGFGGVEMEILDRRVEFQRGWPEGPFPLGLDKSFDAVAYVGQHAKSGTEYAHIAHTQSFSVLDLSVNGISIGEFGQMALCAGELGIPVIFGSGDRAFTIEAERLVPGIETVAVKRGLQKGSGDECSAEEYSMRNNAAIHLHPETAREHIRKGAERALERFKNEKFGIVRLNPPYRWVCSYRHETGKEGRERIETHPDSVIGVMNRIYGK